jgi:uncharacterized membrane protein YqjE
MIDSPVYAPGIFGSVRRLADTSLAVVQNRLELIAVELGEEKTRLISVLVWGALLIFFAFMTIIALTATVVFLLWEHAIYALAGFTALYLIGAVASMLIVKGKIKNPPPFGETIAQLKKDREWLKSRK